ncbi:MAG TPA: hypothetical protein VHV83_08010 [Armatimonadota bacterium]|nr:hypothetical protein [Armatimonadota bacterium]
MNIRYFFMVALACTVLMQITPSSARAALPTGWTGTDVGAPGVVGNETFANDVFTISGAGKGMTDRGIPAPASMRFVWKEVRGDVEIVARLTSVTGGSGAQAGLAIRLNTNATTDDGGICFLPGNPTQIGMRGGCSLDLRVNGPFNYPMLDGTMDTSGKRTAKNPNMPTNPPLWLRIQRMGNDFAVSYSSDGTIWFPVLGPYDSMFSGGPFIASGPFCVGMYVSSNDMVSTAQTTFDHVYVGAPRLAYITSWIGDSFGKARNGWIQNWVRGMFTTADGRCYTNGNDEAHSNSKIYKDGAILRDFGAPACNGMISGARVVVDNANTYYDCGKALYKADLNTEHAQAFTMPPAYRGCTGLAVANGMLYCSDAKTNTVWMFNTSTRQPTGSFTVDTPGNIAVDMRGDLWIVSGTAVKCYAQNGTVTNRAITDVASPTGLCVDHTADRLLICDNGPNQNIRIYTHLTDAPVCSSTFGVTGGIYAAKTRGQMSPLAFYYPQDVGTDSQGNIYTDCGLFGGCMRKFTPDGRLLWEILNTDVYCDCADFDPAADGVDVYDAHARYAMDYRQPGAGLEWKCKSIIYNSPQEHYSRDDRYFKMTRCVRIQNQRFLYLTPQVAGSITIFRFNGDSAIPCGWLNVANMWIDTNANGIEDADETHVLASRSSIYGDDVDADGNIWNVPGHGKFIREYLCQGIVNGVPQYRADKSGYIDYPTPSVFTKGVCRVRYDKANDALYLSGDDDTHPQSGGRTAGVLVSRFSHWSAGNRTPDYTIYVPADEKSTYGINAFAVAGDYLFVNTAPSYTLVYDAADGHLVQVFTPGPEISGGLAWEDANVGFNAFKRSNGEYVTIQEASGHRTREIIFRWTPPKRK